MARRGRRPPSKLEVKEAADRAERRAAGKTASSKEELASMKIEADPLDPPETIMGRPTDFDPAYVEQVEKLCNLGATDAEIADFFGVSVRTIYRWKLKHEDFCHAMRAGKEIADERVERGLYQRSVGYGYVEQQAIKIKTSKETEDVRIVDVEKHMPPDTQASFIWLKNRRKDEWKDRVTQEHTGRDGGPIETRDVSEIELARRVAFMLTRAARQAQRLESVEAEVVPTP